MFDQSSGPQNLDQLHEMASIPSHSVVKFLAALDGDVLVVGAGGKMGFHLCNMLHRGLTQADKKNRLWAVSRFGGDGAELFHRHGIETISCDLTEDVQLKRLPQAENVYFMAGVKFGTADDPALLQRLNIDLPWRLACRFKDSRIVALSTGCVYSFTQPQSGGSSETDETAPVGAYAQSCLGRERSFIRADARCCLIRLNYSVDLRYGVLIDIGQRVFTGQPVDVTTGYANVIWQGDACAAIILALGQATRPPNVLNVSGARILSIRQVAERFGRLFGKQVTITGTESPTAWLSNSRRAHEIFGPPSVDEDLLIQWAADWIKRGGPTLGKPTHFEVRDGNF